MSSMKKESFSRRIQETLDGLFMPRSVGKAIAEIREFQKSRGTQQPTTIKNVVKIDAKTDEDKGKKDDVAAPGPSIDKHFTEIQDKALIELKINSKSWKGIATELGKDQSAIKTRWGQIKPADFEKQMAEKKKEKALQKGTGSVGGEKKEKAEKKGKEEKKNRDENDDQDMDWATPDDEWDKKDLDVLNDLIYEELQEAFSRVSIRLAETTGLKRHPASVAEKFLGAAPSWSDRDQY